MADRLIPAAFADLKGLHDIDQDQALRHMAEVLAFQLQKNPTLGPARLSRKQVQAWSDVASRVRHNTSSPQAFLEEHFNVWKVIDEARPQGLFTGYFEPELKGSRHQSATSPYPVYAKPIDLTAFGEKEQAQSGLAYGKRMNGKPTPFDQRMQIDLGSLKDRAEILCYVTSKIELFFMQVQGSGRVRLESGETLRLGYAAKSGLPYTSIGAVLVKEGAMTRETASMQSIKSWLQDNPDRVDWLLWHNQSYVFFRTLNLADVNRGAYGAAGVQLVPRVSLAIDKTRYAYGTPIWLSTTLPDGSSFARLMIAADTGSAILGAARGDVYFGWGGAAEHLAGHMKQPGEMFVLLPKRP